MTPRVQIASALVNTAAAVAWWVNAIHNDFPAVQVSLAVVYTICATLTTFVALSEPSR